MKAIVTVLGKDQIGIIASVCTLMAGHKVNVLDISQTLLKETFTMVMLVDIAACDIPFADLASALEAEGAARSLSIRIQREEIFSAMHKI